MGGKEEEGCVFLCARGEVEIGAKSKNGLKCDGATKIQSHHVVGDVRPRTRPQHRHYDREQEACVNVFYVRGWGYCRCGRRRRAANRAAVDLSHNTHPSPPIHDTPLT